MKKMKNAGAKQKYGELLSIVPQPLLDALVQEEVVPFVGAGFSKNCNGPDGFSMPDWRDLGKRVADTMPDYAYDGNPIEALSVYEYKNQRSALVELLRKICRISEISPGETHRLLCSCFPRMICTTNFDFLIEDALNEMHIGRRVVTSSIDQKSRFITCCADETIPSFLFEPYQLVPLSKLKQEMVKMLEGDLIQNA